MITRIISNGSKWAGQDPDPIEKLYELLQAEPLDPRFEKSGGFCYNGTPGKAMLHFHGNFANVSHVFSIETDDPIVIENLITLIRNNQASTAYKGLQNVT